MNEWWRAAAFVAGGLVAGAFVGAMARRALDRPTRRDPLRRAARPAAALLFWLLVAAGLVAAVASTSPETLDPLPSDILSWLPRAGAAGLVLIGGFVLAAIAAPAVSRAATRASGRRQPIVEAATRLAVFTGAGILALSQLGFDTTILNILVAALALGLVSAMAGLAVVGGAPVARAIAAGRTVADALEPGARVSIGAYTGTVNRVSATHVVLDAETGDTVIVPLGSVTDTPVIIHSVEDR